jgi:hypothetical protein
LPVRHHIVIVEPQNSKALRCKKRIPPDVALDMGIFEMLTAIELNDEIGGMTDKVSNIGSTRCLPPKARTVEPVSSQFAPNQALCVRQITAQRSRA